MRWAVLVLCAFPLLLAADETDDLVSAGAKVDKQRVDAAVKKAADWLKGQQRDDGSWQGTGTYMEMYPFGTTALAVYALIKAGVNPNDECIQKALKWLKSKGFPGTYSVSCLVLALSALCEPKEVEEEIKGADEKKLEKIRTRAFEPVDKQMKKRLRRMPPWVNDWLRQAVRWIVKAKTKSVWRYPGKDPGEAGCKKGTGIGGGVDASNAQYAMLALFAARRLGIDVPKNLFVEVAEYYLKEQDKDGPEVKPFPVPVADLPVNRLRKMIRERLKELQKEARKIEPTAEGKKELLKKLRTQAVLKENPYRKFGVEQKKMKARGWCYLPRSMPKSGNELQDMFKTTGSMTASGVIALALCKVELEGTGWYKKKGRLLEQAIRDGVAWLAHNWTIDRNPNAGVGDAWRYYYLYGIERVGALGMLRKIGEHFWYEEVANRILGEQQADGSWAGESGQAQANVLPFEHGPLWNTCFAMLILKRATPPIVGGGRKDVVFSGKGILGRDNERAPQK